MGVGDTFHPTPVGVFFGGPGAAPGQRWPTRSSAAPGPDAQDLPRLRRLHDRLPPQRQEHPGQELPLPRRAARRRGRSRSRPSPGSGPRRAAGTTCTCRSPGEAGPAYAAARVTAEPGGVRRRLARHPAAAAPAQATRATCRRLSDRLGELTRTNSESIVGAIAPPTPRSTTASGVAITSSLPPRRRHPHRAGPLRPRLATSWGCCRPCSPTATATQPRWRPGCGELWRAAPRRPRTLYDMRHWSERTVIAPGDAVAGQLDHDATPSGSPARLAH